MAGQVTVQGRHNAEGVEIQVDGNVVALTSSAGNFETTDLAAGTHQVRAFLPGYLSAEKAEVTVVGGQTTTLSTVQLRGGDVNGNDKVKLPDLVLVAGHYGTLPPSDPRADINSDGAVDLLDLVLVASNYGLTGPTQWP